MRKIISVLLCFSICLGLCACGGNTINTTAVKLSDGYESNITEYNYYTSSFERAQHSMAMRVFAAVSAENSDKNVLLSPISLANVLGILSNGAAGDTKTEIEQLLGISASEFNHSSYSFFNSLPKSSRLQSLNSIWLNNNLPLKVEKDFLQTNANFYNADIFQTPFNDAAVNDINKWVKDATDGEIDNIVQKINKNTLAYIINALTFEAEWLEPYAKESVSSGKFYSGTNNITTEFMRSTESYYIKTANATGFIKPYKNDEYRFVALLPNEGIDINEYISSLEFTSLNSIISSVSEQTVKVEMPKFESRFEITLNSIMKNLGVNTAFDMDKADFSKLGSLKDANLYLAEVKQKTFISVDTNGTKAGAVTKAEIAVKTSLPDQIYSVILNRPFVYAIVHSDTNLPLFIGKVIEP